MPDISFLTQKSTTDLLVLILGGIGGLLLIGALALRLSGIETFNFKTGKIEVDTDGNPVPKTRVTRRTVKKPPRKKPV